MGVPTFYTRLLQEPRLDRATRARTCGCSSPARRRCSPKRTASGGSAPATRILERYGMTETNMNTSNPYDGERVAGTVGFPLPGVELRIADPESGAPCRRARSA